MHTYYNILYFKYLILSATCSLPYTILDEFTGICNRRKFLCSNTLPLKFGY